MESLRLADYLALSHEQAAVKMKISRATFGRIVETARKKIVNAILNGKAIRIGNEMPQLIKEKAIVKCSKYKSLLRTNSEKGKLNVVSVINKPGEKK